MIALPFDSTHRLIVPNTDPYRTDVNLHAPTEDKVLNDSPRGSLGSPNQSHNLSGCLPMEPDSGHGLLRPLCMYIRCAVHLGLDHA